MPFSEFMKDNVVVIKSNGERLEGIKACVQTKKTYIDRSDILIEPNDLIERIMSNGGKEMYRVIDPGFHESFAEIPAGYQIVHENLGIKKLTKPTSNVTYNITGDNARVNNNSVDNSINTINKNNDINAQIELLRQEIKKIIKNPADDLEIVEAIQEQFDSEKPSKPVLKTLINALPNIASIATIGAFLLSCIS